MKQFKKPNFVWKRRRAGLVRWLLPVLSLLVTPFLYILVGIAISSIVMFICGGFIADGLNILFGTDRFEPSHLPLIGGTFGFFGSFIHNKIGINLETKETR